MNDLPDDVDRWPRDPYQLLGVARGADEQAVRRAYTQLIRRFQPEFHPEQFRRIHEAYTRLRKSAEPIRPTREELPLSPSQPASKPDPSANQGVIPLASTAESIWKTATEDPERAYAQLLDRCRMPMCDTDDFAAMYWLHRICPDLVRETVATHWLIKGMRRRDPDDLLLHLFRRHMRWYPEEALGDELRSFVVEFPLDSVSHELLRHRWKAASLRDQPQAIVADMDVLRDSLAMSNPNLWVSLLVAAATRLLSFDASHIPALIRTYMEEAHELRGTQPQLHDAFDELEFKLDVHRSWQTMRTSNAPIVQSLSELVTHCWDYDPSELLWSLRRWIAECQVDPERALDRLSSELSPCDPLFAQAEYLLVQGVPRAVRMVITEIGEVENLLVADFLRQITEYDWELLRFDMLRFCLSFGLAPGAVGRQLEFSEMHSTVSRDLSEDRALQLVWLTAMLGTTT